MSEHIICGAVMLVAIVPFWIWKRRLDRVERDLDFSDKERLYWLLPRLSGRSLRDCGVVYSEGSISSKIRAIDVAMGNIPADAEVK